VSFLKHCHPVEAIRDASREASTVMEKRAVEESSREDVYKGVTSRFMI